MRINHTEYKLRVTSDALIRESLILLLNKELRAHQDYDDDIRIIAELGVQHGDSRVDVAVINGVMHGYEIKSDLDTLNRLEDQERAFSDVFDRMTLVVGKTHLREALEMVPDWWDIWIAKMDSDGSVAFRIIREGERNPNPSLLSIARLLWKQEALRILEEIDCANGFYSKSCDQIYERLVSRLDHETLANKVRKTLCFRNEWRVDQPLMTSGG